MKILLTGGAGFIGSAVIREIINHSEHSVLNVDKLTYAGNLASLSEIDKSARYQFAQLDICDKSAISKIIDQYQPQAIMHLAAESHVDRSIDGPADFIQTNIVGTFNLLECARNYFSSLADSAKSTFRFLHVSTDEVYGDLGDEGLFTEETAYDPSSPYSASKASSDHLVRAWQRSYGLPTLVTNCSNNYGPYHFPEKLIPHMIINALQEKPLPVYGAGNQIRDWLYVEDHARALITALEKGQIGETYNIGGHNEHQNISVINSICRILDERKPRANGLYKELIKHVDDRPGHDTRYAIDATNIYNALGWAPRESFESGLNKTIDWYLANEHWWQNILTGDYNLDRLGAGENT